MCGVQMSPCDRKGLESGERIVAREPCAVYKCHTQRYQLAQRYLSEQMDVMDYGCGIGYGSFLMSAYCKSVLSIEKDEETVQHAKRWFHRYNITYLNQDYVPKNLNINLITAFEVIEHVESGESLVKEFYEALKPNGILVFSVPDQTSVPFKQEEHEFHHRHYTAQELRDLITGAGFKLELEANQPSKRFPELRAGFGGWTNIGVARK